MPQMDTGAILTAVGLVVGGIVWLVRLEGKVNLHQELIKTVTADVRYIRKRIDAALNGGHGVDDDE